MVLRGFLNIDKPAGMTSFDVVRQVRRAAGIRKVGHAGTLDPAATGVLPIAIGDATKLIDELVDAPKRYRGTIRFGIATDTYDADGAVVAETDASAITRDRIEAELDAFRGTIMQVPPAYSAVKRQGVPAYKAARRGEPLELEARPVTVHELGLGEFDRSDREHPSVTIEVACSRGFYVRSLAHDLGQALGVGAHLDGLCRTAVGSFEVKRATPLEAACALLEAGETEDLLHAMDAVLTSWPAVIVGTRDRADLRQGRDIIAMPRRDYVAPPVAEGRRRRARCYGPDGQLVALLEQSLTVGAWHPYRVIPPA
jgi:tRNA pseudouridine55 synthase